LKESNYQFLNTKKFKFIEVQMFEISTYYKIKDMFKKYSTHDQGMSQKCQA